MSDLTWEQREQVLRELFARMNGHKSRGNDKTLAIENKKKSNDDDDNENDDDDNNEDKTVKFLDRSDLKRPSGGEKERFDSFKNVLFIF